DDIKAHYAQQKPYQRWVNAMVQPLTESERLKIKDDSPTANHPAASYQFTSHQSSIFDHQPSTFNPQPPTLNLQSPTPNSQQRSSALALPITQLQAAFGYTAEELIVVLREMAEEGAEPIGSMGDDTPHAVLSELDRPLYHYFKQRFAEVTNPPIDHLRE